MNFVMRFRLIAGVNARANPGRGGFALSRAALPRQSPIMKLVSGKAVAVVWIGLVGLLALPARAADADAEKTALAVEALGRLQGVDINANPKLKEAVLRVLEKTRGTANFVKLVQQFNLTGQETGLIEIAAARPAEQTGVEAIRLLLGADLGAAAIRTALAGTNAVRIATSLGYAADKRAVPLIQPLLADARNGSALRIQAVQSLVKTAEGANELLAAARDGKLDDTLRTVAAMELSAVRWPEIQAAAAKVLPPSGTAQNRALPPISELVKRAGNAAVGEKFFFAANPGCANCHVVRGRGMELGPNLTEIGTKLGKDALYQAILEPSAGISFGFEAWTFTLKDGEDAYGLIASETAEEVALKTVGGIITRLKKSEISARQQSKLSIMPAGLAEAIPLQDLIDLVEYMTTLKRP